MPDPIITWFWALPTKRHRFSDSSVSTFSSVDIHTHTLQQVINPLVMMSFCSWRYLNIPCGRSVDVIHDVCCLQHIDDGSGGLGSFLNGSRNQNLYFFFFLWTFIQHASDLWALRLHSMRKYLTIVVSWGWGWYHTQVDIKLVNKTCTSWINP